MINRKNVSRHMLLCIMAVAVLLSSVLLLASCGGAGQEQEGQEAQETAGTQEKGSEKAHVDRIGPDHGEYLRELKYCKSQIEKITDFKPEIVLVLGSGLNDYAEKLDVIEKIPYEDIDGWPVSTVEGHEGNLIFAEYRGLKLAVMQGRVHYYEGYTMDEVVKPLRVLHMLGADTVILTNAVGAINTDYEVGDFVVVEDHISSFVPSPLIGENIDELGERFAPMDKVYDEEMRNTVLNVARENDITVHSGVFLQTTGPHYESPAEIEMFREFGADTVGMSSVVEAIAATHMGMKVCDINSVTNMAAGIEEFDHESISDNSAKTVGKLEILIAGLIDSLADKR